MSKNVDSNYEKFLKENYPDIYCQYRSDVSKNKKNSAIITNRRQIITNANMRDSISAHRRRNTYKYQCKQEHKLSNGVKYIPNEKLEDKRSVCSVCLDGRIVQKNGKYGLFYSCNKFPKCRATFTKLDDGKYVVKHSGTS